MGEAGEIGREIGRRASLLMASATLSRLTTLTGWWSGWSDWSRVWTTGEAGRANHLNGIKPPLRPDAAKGYIGIGAMDDTRSDDLIRRNRELLAAAAKARSDFMETAARIDHMRTQARMPVRFGTGRRWLAGTAHAWNERTDPTRSDHQPLDTSTLADRS